MGESVDVKALRAMFHAQANMATNISSSEDSGQTTSPLPGFGRGALLGANGLGQNKQFPASPLSAPVPSHRQGKYKAPPSAIPAMKPQYRAPVVQAALTPGPRAHATESGRVRQTGEMLQNIMLSHPRPPSAKLTPGTSTPSVAPALPPGPAIPVTPARPLPSRASLDDVTPLRRPLPPEGPWPIKPRRPPKVNLEPYLRAASAPKIPKHPGQMKNISLSTPGLFSPPGPPRPPKKPSGLAQQLTPIMDDDNSDDTYDDIGSLGNSDSLNDVSQRVGGASDDSEAYDVIDDKLDVNKGHSDKLNQKEVKRQREQEKKEQKELRKREIALRKKFQLQGEIEVLYTARVRQDWQGGKLDLSVQQGESVEILRVKNNPGGKWLVRTLTGKYGYISNTCVDIDYEEVKRNVLHAKGSPALPPPPPDPPQNHNGYFHVDSANREDSLSQDDQDDYAYVEPSDSFPPPPPEISIDPKLERELKKKFKFEGPLRIIHTMMVDPNGIIRKPGAKDLAVAQGEILDVIQHTSDKKALCRNQLGKFGYVSRSLLLQMEGDIYDDIDTHEDVYDND